MDQITGALIGITLVLTAVFIPMAFFSGSVGTIYRQFSLSLVSSMLFSVFLAMSLTPALCATLLKPIPKGHKHEKRGFFGWFNRSFTKSTKRYQSGVGRVLRHTWAFMLVFVVVIGAVALLYIRLPSSFLPAEDQGYFITNIQLPVGAAQDRTDAVLRQVEDYFLKQPEIESFITVAGFSFNGTNSAVDYRNGIDFHADFAASQFIGKTVHAGLVGYLYQQVTGDSGTGAKLGDNKGAAIGIGPQIGFFFPAWQGYTGYVNLRGYADIYTENRPTSTTFMATVSFSPAAPEHPPAPRTPQHVK